MQANFVRTMIGPGLSVLVLSAVAFASGPGGDDDATAQIKAQAARIELLERRLAVLEADQQADWMTEQRADQLRALVREVLADAETRQAFADDPLYAGHNGKHFFLASPDGRFTMEVGGQIQLRYVGDWRTDSGEDDFEGGFQIRRAKVYFEGTVVSPRVHYALQLAIARDSQTVSTDKIVVGYDLSDALYLWAGEDKAPFLREEMISSKRQLAVDRSLVTEAFTLDKVQGLGLNWQALEQLRLQAMLHDGMRSGEAPGDDWVGDEWAGFRDSKSKDFNDDATDFAVTGRVDLLLAGDWNQWKDYTSKPGDELFAYIGGAIDYEVGETGDSSSNNNWLSWTVDAEVKFDGWAISAAYVGATTGFDDSATNPGDYSPWGVQGQVSYRFPLGVDDTSLEAFVRFEHIDIDDLGGALPAGRGSTANLLTVGGNWYLASHASKFTADVVIAFDPLHDSMPGVTDGIGLLHDADGEDGQTVLRVQYQLLF